MRNIHRSTIYTAAAIITASLSACLMEETRTATGEPGAEHLVSADDDWVEGDSTLIEDSFEEAYDETELASFPEPEMEPTIEEYIEEYAKLTGADPAVLATMPARHPRKLKNCLKACEGGPDAIEKFCRKLPARALRERALCWAVVFAGEAGCKGFCYARYL